MVLLHFRMHNPAMSEERVDEDSSEAMNGKCKPKEKHAQRSLKPIQEHQQQHVLCPRVPAKQTGKTSISRFRSLEEC